MSFDICVDETYSIFLAFKRLMYARYHGSRLSVGSGSSGEVRVLLVSFTVQSYEKCAD